MKKISLFAMAICLFLSTKAQGLIVLKNTNEIKADIKTIGINEVTYLRWENLDGPTYTLLKSDIFFIKYANGKKEVMISPINNDQYTNKVDTEKDQDSLFKRTFMGYIYLGADFMNSCGGPFIDVSLGTRMSKYLYLGGGISYHNLINKYAYETVLTNEWLYSINLTTDLKVYPSYIGRFYPRFDISLGLTYCGHNIKYVSPEASLQEKEYLAGIYMNVGTGFDYRRLSFGIGYQTIIRGNIIHFSYVRLGVRFGKNF